MLRKALFIIALTGLACGSHETKSGATAGSMGAVQTETPRVSAVQPPSGAAAPTMEVTTCLELVNGGKYADAGEICQTAATQDPTNADVATALAKASGATAAQGAAGAAAGAATASDDAAASAADSATGAVGDTGEKASD
jgi:hypothetical protein